MAIQDLLDAASIEEDENEQTALAAAILKLNAADQLQTALVRAEHRAASALTNLNAVHQKAIEQLVERARTATDVSTRTSLAVAIRQLGGEVILKGNADSAKSADKTNLTAVYTLVVASIIEEAKAATTSTDRETLAARIKLLKETDALENAISTAGDGSTEEANLRAVLAMIP